MTTVVLLIPDRWDKFDFMTCILFTYFSIVNSYFSHQWHRETCFTVNIYRKGDEKEFSFCVDVTAT